MLPRGHLYRTRIYTRQPEVREPITSQYQRHPLLDQPMRNVRINLR